MEKITSNPLYKLHPVSPQSSTTLWGYNGELLKVDVNTTYTERKTLQMVCVIEARHNNSMYDIINKLEISSLVYFDFISRIIPDKKSMVILNKVCRNRVRRFLPNHTYNYLNKNVGFDLVDFAKKQQLSRLSIGSESRIDVSLLNKGTVSLTLVIDTMPNQDGQFPIESFLWLGDNLAHMFNYSNDITHMLQVEANKIKNTRYAECVKSEDEPVTFSGDGMAHGDDVIDINKYMIKRGDLIERLDAIKRIASKLRVDQYTLIEVISLLTADDIDKTDMDKIYRDLVNRHNDHIMIQKRMMYDDAIKQINKSLESQIIKLNDGNECQSFFDGLEKFGKLDKQSEK